MLILFLFVSLAFGGSICVMNKNVFFCKSLMFIHHGINFPLLRQTTDELNKTRNILNTILICARKMLLFFKVLNVSLTKKYRLQMYACTTGGTQRAL